MCALHKVASLFLFLTLFVPPTVLHAQPKPEDPFEELLLRVRSIEERLVKVEANQKEILDREEKILAELDTVRVWATRR